jgi:hypothetical protein
MENRMSLESNMKRSVIGSSSSAYDEHEPPGVDHNEAPQAQTLFFNVGSSSVRVTHKKDVPSYQDVYTGKYIF